MDKVKNCYFHPLIKKCDTIYIMIIDGIPATQVPENGNFAERSVASFLKFIEKKLDVSVIRNIRGISDDYTLLEPLRLAALLKENGIIKKVSRDSNSPDEPRIKSWQKRRWRNSEPRQRIGIKDAFFQAES